MNVPIVEAQPLSTFYNPEKDAQNNLNQIIQMRGLQQQDERNDLAVRKEQVAEQARVALQNQVRDAFDAYGKNPTDDNAKLGVVKAIAATGKVKEAYEMILNDTGVAAMAKATGFPMPELQGMANLPAEQFKQLYGPELEKNLRVNMSNLVNFYQDNAKFTGAFQVAVDAETYYEKIANEAVGADRAIINLLSGKKDLSASEKERLTTAESSLATSEAKIAEQRQRMDAKITQYASTVRDGALSQQDTLARAPKSDARQQQLYSDVYALKASVADAYLTYKNEATPENKRAFQDASDRYDTKVKEIAIRATEYKTEAEKQMMANTQKTVQGMKQEEADREAQARFAALPRDQQTSQSAEKIARKMLEDGFALPDITKMRGAGKDPNRPLVEINQNSPGERKDISEDRAKLDMVNEVKALFDPAYTGPVDSRISGVKQIFNQLKPEESDFRAKVGLMKAEIRKFFAGTAQSKQELKTLVDALPSLDQSDEQFKSSLRVTETNIINKLKQIHAVQTESGVKAPAVPSTPSTGGWSIKKKGE